MSTNDKTPDPAPALLSTARLAEIRERVSYTVIAEAHNEAIADRAALLAHLDALMVCVLYTAVGPINANEVGACGADPAEIDEPDLVTAIKARLDKAARKASK